MSYVVRAHLLVFVDVGVLVCSNIYSVHFINVWAFCRLFSWWEPILEWYVARLVDENGQTVVAMSLEYVLKI